MIPNPYQSPYSNQEAPAAVNRTPLLLAAVGAGQTSAAKNRLWLHGVGGVFAVIAMASGNPITLVLQGLKVAIHIFGAITAYMAFRAAPA